MPFIDAKFSCDISKEKEEVLVSRLKKAIPLLSGKSDSYLMIQLQDNCRLFFKGDTENDIAMFEVKVFGKCSKADCEKLTKELCSIAKEELCIRPDRVYVKFEETEYWGYNSFMF